MKNNNKIQGFTLLELMITLAIAIILTAIGIPSFMGLIRDSQMTTNANDFFTALSYARSEAATRNEVVIIQKIGGAPKIWRGGWEIRTDLNNDGDFTDTGELLKTHNELPEGYTLTANSPTFNTQISFQPTGLMTTSVNGRFYLCLNNHIESSREITINNVGRARVSAPAASCS